MIARMIISTQYRENYGAHSWDGNGQCPQYWKNKGGSDYLIATFTSVSELNSVSTEELEEIADKAVELVSHSDEYSESSVLGWCLYYDDEKTDMEEMYAESSIPSVANPTIDLTEKMVA